ncbi:hypothetical protein TNCV_3917161 [Trichonephila clavipes]|nr:hypothetical protein TNCV_3917161 [Trichonephila clavipes]
MIRYLDHWATAALSGTRTRTHDMPTTSDHKYSTATPLEKTKKFSIGPHTNNPPPLRTAVVWRRKLTTRSSRPSGVNRDELQLKMDLLISRI